MITGPDDAASCRRISALLDEGYRPHGSPAVAFGGERVVAAQALVWPHAPAGSEPGAAGGVAEAARG
ncbi:DUF1737 domain-containing protein [Streptoalloteichus hindustanus]|uniref:DUF1737 domain-containing protein n=1 Tax=Streptoalloteichus hindustanus TaxID=2017 RepID=A0A1M5BQT7_STRHI|nr:DUF1737 domain-containing protein [Streptoalloteichus hindustanus]SHF44740.1 protein of unknown function [Streptoalloteichus hindustanus]